MKTKDALTITLPPGTRIDTEFTCPECGGYTFGSTGHPSSSEFTGHCHGEVWGDGGYVSCCAFSWNRKDDFKFFRLVVVTNSPEHWDALYQLQNLEVQTGKTEK